MTFTFLRSLSAAPAAAYLQTRSGTLAAAGRHVAIRRLTSARSVGSSSRVFVCPFKRVSPSGCKERWRPGQLRLTNVSWKLLCPIVFNPLIVSRAYFTTDDFVKSAGALSMQTWIPMAVQRRYAPDHREMICTLYIATDLIYQHSIKNGEKIRPGP